MGCGPSVSSGSVDLLTPSAKIRAGAASLKVVVAGKAGVGKSCLAQRWVHNTFETYHRATIGSAFLSKSVSVSVPSSPGRDDGVDTSVKLHIWDTAGEERFRAVARSFFRGAKGALLVFDVTSVDSLEEVEHWVRLLEMEAHGVVMLLVGTKADLEESRAVSQDSALAMADKHGMAGYAETSARTGAGVDEVFVRMAELLVARAAH